MEKDFALPRPNYPSVPDARAICPYNKGLNGRISCPSIHIPTFQVAHGSCQWPNFMTIELIPAHFRTCFIADVSSVEGLRGQHRSRPIADIPSRSCSDRLPCPKYSPLSHAIDTYSFTWLRAERASQSERI